MGFFDKAKEVAGQAFDKVKEGAEIAADKAKDLAETTKQKARISEAEKGIKDVYTTMGRLLLEQFPDLAKEKFPDQIGKIDEFNKAIDTAKAVIASLNDKAAEVKEAAEEAAEEVAEAAEAVKDAVE